MRSGPAGSISDVVQAAARYSPLLARPARNRTANAFLSSRTVVFSLASPSSLTSNTLPQLPPRQNTLCQTRFVWRLAFSSLPSVHRVSTHGLRCCIRLLLQIFFLFFVRSRWTSCCRPCLGRVWPTSYNALDTFCSARAVWSAVKRRTVNRVAFTDFG
jgi:hypothetical protein